MSAYSVDELTGREYLFGRLMYYNRTLPLPDILGSGVYVGGSAELARVPARIGDLPAPGTMWSLSAFVGADSFLGPTYFGLGVGEDSRSSLYLLLGAP